jgi:hypothetical protein
MRALNVGTAWKEHLLWCAGHSRVGLTTHCRCVQHFLEGTPLNSQKFTDSHPIAAAKRRDNLTMDDSAVCPLAFTEDVQSRAQTTQQHRAVGPVDSPTAGGLDDGRGIST